MRTLAWTLALALAACSGNTDDNNNNGSDAGTNVEEDSAFQWSQIPDAANFPYGGNIYTGTRTDPKPANLSCKGASEPTSTQTSLVVKGKLEDFQNSTPVLNAEVAVWNDLAKLGEEPLAKVTTNAADGTFTITVPGVQGKSRLHWRSYKEGETFATWELNDPFDVNAATDTIDRSNVSLFTGEALPALAGITRTPGKGIIAGAIRDCDGKEIGNAIATVLGADGKPLAGMQVVYMSDQDLPRRRDDPRNWPSIATNAKNGIFIVVDVPPQTGSVLLAVDGNVDGVRKRLAQFSAPVFADTVVVVDTDPRQAP